MNTGKDYLQAFSNCKDLGLLNEKEFNLLEECLFAHRDAAPPWLASFAEACGRAARGQMSPGEFNVLKARFFRNLKSSNDKVIHSDVIQTHPAGTEPDADEDSARSIRNCALAAALIGLIPLPVADAPFLIVTQFIMLKSICSKYGRTPGLSFILIILSALLGPIIFNIFVKALPLAGSIIGAAIAGSFTWYIGSKVRAMLMNGQDFTLDNFLRAKISDRKM